MVISEETRHRLYRRLEEVLGPSEATTLMEHLPPVGWADVATKRDLDALEARMEARMDARFARQEAAFERALQAMTWRLVTVVVGVIAALGSLVVTGVRV